ncbi:uncharacterized protein LOC114294969 [Camellia sinensis]|uniref:uncharacterized protein LOC114294969 n=1 Tax=Camellia sinensis TaxID=4442 RepID=UPI0010366568|nr:uncharacterized protein LOC114294969 [Camellia sinensis]
MKKEIAEFISRCLQCQQVKAEHQRPAGLLQSLPIPKWKWEHITMDFIVGLPRTPRGMDSIWVVVDIFTKPTHFLPVKTVYNADRLATVYIAEIIRLHSVPVSIVSNRDSKCRTPACWTEVGDRSLIGPEIVQVTTEKIPIIQQRLKTAQSRQKSYADQRRRDLEFEVGAHVFVKVTLMKGHARFGKKGKLSPRYIGPFQILESLGPVAYQIALPPSMEQMHNVFHVSMLRGYL